MCGSVKIRPASTRPLLARYFQVKEAVTSTLSAAGSQLQQGIRVLSTPAPDNLLGLVSGERPLTARYPLMTWSGGPRRQPALAIRQSEAHRGTGHYRKAVPRAAAHSPTIDHAGPPWPPLSGRAFGRVGYITLYFGPPPPSGTCH